MRNFVSRPEQYGRKYDSIFESSLQSPIPDKDKLQYFRSMFDDDVRSYLTDEDREEIAQEVYAKRSTEIAKAMLGKGIAIDVVAECTGMTVNEVLALQ